MPPDTESPAPVPGDAESSLQPEAGRTTRKAVNQTDPTEPGQASQPERKKPG
jgi:hypothetical protein